MTTPNETTERAVFEAWARTDDGNCNELDLRKWSPMDRQAQEGATYRMNLVERDWIVWQAARAALPPTSAEPVAPADPMDWPLPCDVKIGAGTIRKGCKLRTLVLRATGLHRMLMEATPEPTPEQRAAFEALIAPAAPVASPDLNDALSAVLWLYRRLPRGYDRQSHIERVIKALATATGSDADVLLRELGREAAAVADTGAVELDPVVEKVREALLTRSQLGIKKYGDTLYNMNYSEREILQHAIEESMDLSNYLMARIMKIDEQCTCPSGDGSLRWPCPAHPATPTASADSAADARDAWISVEDRLPQSEESVLIVLASGAIEKTCWYGGEFLRKSSEQPTHWMPLPQPPKEA